MDERLEVFLEMLYGDMPAHMKEIEEHAKKLHTPIMRKQTAWCIRYFIQTCEIKNILEIGTAIGYSALFMAGCDSDIRIDTIEKVPERIHDASANFEKYDVSGQIKLIDGDAGDVLSKLSGQGKIYDMVFLDAAKAQYMTYLKYIEGILRKGGILITDNVLQEGMILESRYAVTRRDRTIHKRMREYLNELTHSDIWNTIILPIGDGISVSTRLSDQ